MAEARARGAAEELLLACCIGHEEAVAALQTLRALCCDAQTTPSKESMSVCTVEELPMHGHGVGGGAAVEKPASTRSSALPQLLINAVNLRDGQGGTPLLYAVRRGWPDVTSSLVGLQLNPLP